MQYGHDLSLYLPQYVTYSGLDLLRYQMLRYRNKTSFSSGAVCVHVLMCLYVFCVGVIT